MTRARNAALRLVGLWVVMHVSLSCAPKTVTIKTTPQFDPQRIQTIAVLSFDSLATPQRSSRPWSVLSHPEVARTEYYSGLRIDPSVEPTRLSTNRVAVPEGAPGSVTRMVFAKLDARPRIRAIPPEQTAKTMSLLQSAHPDLTAKELAKELGKHLGADGILRGLVRIYREREGTKFAANPAAVGFDVQLISVRDGSLLWEGDFYEEQKPLIEDFFGFFERKGKFITVNELARSGVNRVMDRFPVGK